MIELPTPFAHLDTPSQPICSKTASEKSADLTVLANVGQDKYDKRSVEQITHTPLFSDMQKMFTSLPNGDRYLQQFFQQVGGDWRDPTLTARAKANIAANAERVLEHIDKLGGRHSTAENNRLDGLRQNTKGKPAYRHSEAARLLNFCEQGYSIFQDSPEPTSRPQGPLERPTYNTGRDLDDHRSAYDIVRGPLFRRLLPDSPKTAKPILEGQRAQNFYTQVGGNWNSPELTADEKANIAANAERVLRYIDSLSRKGSTANNRRIEGTHSSRPPPPYTDLHINRINVAGSEARMLTDFCEKGYSALK